MKKKKTLLIEAISTSSGGAIVHLKNILDYSLKQKFYDEITVMLPEKTFKLMPKNKNIIYIYNNFLNSNLILRIFWQVIILNIYIKFKKFDAIFITGSSHFLFERNIITINQNLLPYFKKEVDKYFFSLFYLKLKFLKFTQRMSLKLSEKVIFLHKFSRKVIISQIAKTNFKSKVIPHGVDLKKIKYQNLNNKKYRFIYVSNIDFYKNQDFIIDSFESIFKEYPELTSKLYIEFYGGFYKPALQKMRLKLKKLKKLNKNFKYLGKKNINEIYKNKKNFTTISLFASSCENFSVSLIESMATGYPIVCVKLDPMKSVLGDTAIFYKHNYTKDFKEKILNILKKPQVLKKKREKAFIKSKNYNNKKMAFETYKFLNQ